MNPIRKLFLKGFGFFLTAFVIQWITGLAPEWRIGVLSIAGVMLLFAIVTPLGRPFQMLWNGYNLATSEGMRFLQGVGIFSLIVAYYQLVHITCCGKSSMIVEFMNGNFPAGGYRYWAIAGVVLFILGLIRPASDLLFDLWMKMALALHFVVSKVILSIVFILVVMPIGFLARISGSKFLDKELKPEASTYWLDRPEKEFDPRHYERHF